ncbi:MAG: aspartate--tRNA ligase [Nanoarchaeota archaeon]
MYRTHTCGELREDHDGKTVTLAGWIHTIRTHGNVTFIDLRDRYGITQIAASEELKGQISVKRESVVQISGVVRKKPQPNKNLATGAIEVQASNITILSSAAEMPLDIHDVSHVTEDTRLKYRYLDLRRDQLQRNLAMRHRVVKAVRDYLDSQGFLDIETPVLAKSTPEGARDYLVPSRVHKGKFYALPQSPQQFKQLLMVAGFDRYAQIVKCFRDEDTRADRQPEFTQIDIEMSFVDRDDVMRLVEGLVAHVWKNALDLEAPTIPRIAYHDAMRRFGLDAPDLRFGLELHDITALAKRSGANVLTTANYVNALVVPKGGAYSRKDIDELTSVAKTYDAKGLVALKATSSGLDGPLVKHLEAAWQGDLRAELDANVDDLILIIGDEKRHIAQVALGRVRLAVGEKMGLRDPSKFSFAWIIDFPLLEYSEDEKRHVAVHHPFTRPHPEDIDKLETSPGDVRSMQYDLVLNGSEIAGGSIRIHERELQQKIFNLLHITAEEQEIKFGHLLKAFSYGAPPHGGIAFGLDRFVAIIQHTDNIREVIAFPKNKNAVSLMDEAPDTVDAQQLDELGLSLKK